MAKKEELQKRQEEYLNIILDICRDTTVQQKLHNNAALNSEFIKGNQWIFNEKFSR